MGNQTAPGGAPFTQESSSGWNGHPRRAFLFRLETSRSRPCLISSGRCCRSRSWIRGGACASSNATLNSDGDRFCVARHSAIALVERLGRTAGPFILSEVKLLCPLRRCPRKELPMSGAEKAGRDAHGGVDPPN